jgi:type II secretory pathway component GspD/PulD (secretin)
MSGIPGLGGIPGLNQVTASNTRGEDDDELMIVITPHILANISPTTPEIWVSQK